MEKGWPKRPSEHQLQEARKKTLIGPELLEQRQSVSPHTSCHQGPCKPSSCATFTLNSNGGRAATGKRQNSHVSVHRVTLVVSNILWPCRLWPARLLCQGVLWARILGSVLANTGFHPLLEQYSSCCPSRQPP